MMMASAKLVRDCSSELSSDVRSLSVTSSIEEQESTTTDSEYTEEEKEYELEDLQILKTIVFTIMDGRARKLIAYARKIKVPPFATMEEVQNIVNSVDDDSENGTGTFGRVCLCRDKAADEYLAMKILSMADVIRLKQVDHVMNEKNILAEINHPFIVNLRWWTHDDTCIYMLFDYVCGGELFSYLRNAGRFSNSIGNFYAAEIVSALEYLHARNIVYRDLKPENLLLAKDGHLKITDFGFAKKLSDRTWTLCGTPEYLAPEIIQSKGHNKAVDWWALGVLIYEMLVGYPPFYDDNPFGIYEKILNGRVEWPRHLDPVAKDIIKKLLVQDRTKRLGNMKCGSEDVKRHRWFKHLDWADVFMKKLQPPIIPSVSYEGDTSNFDEYPETDWKAVRALDSDELKLFANF